MSGRDLQAYRVRRLGGVFHKMITGKNRPLTVMAPVGKLKLSGHRGGVKTTL